MHTRQLPAIKGIRSDRAELANNSVLHGRVQGRDFRLGLTHDPDAGVLRIAVTDAGGERLPTPVTDFVAPLHSESGRGLLIVTALADRKQKQLDDARAVVTSARTRLESITSTLAAAERARCSIRWSTHR
ncbi:ATP-binding protein [Streptomyces hirsutus]|uniref:ATP-binding protein n=1 Tax=Streptomyces hirsutus TaxID=35620 RepID=UPI0033CC9CF7